MKAGDHGPDGLYEKFHVYKAKEAEEVVDDSGREMGLLGYHPESRIGVDGEFIFVLRPETYDMAAQAALLEYARCCEHAYPELAQQISAQVRRINDEAKAIADENNLPIDEAYRLRAAMRKAKALAPKGQS